MDRKEAGAAPVPETDCGANYRAAIDRFVVGYNKSVVLTPVTDHSLEILDGAMGRIEAELSSIVTAFEEIRATSGSTAGNSARIDSMMGEILSKNAVMGSDIREPAPSRTSPTGRVSWPSTPPSKPPARGAWARGSGL